MYCRIETYKLAQSVQAVFCDDTPAWRPSLWRRERKEEEEREGRWAAREELLLRRWRGKVAYRLPHCYFWKTAGTNQIEEIYHPLLKIGLLTIFRVLLTLFHLRLRRTLPWGRWRSATLRAVSRASPTPATLGRRMLMMPKPVICAFDALDIEKRFESIFYD